MPRNAFALSGGSTGQEHQGQVFGLSDGGFLGFWSSGAVDGNSNGIAARKYNSQGQPVSQEVLVNTHTGGSQHGLRVTELANGNILTVWESDLQDGSGFGVFGQIFDTDLNKVGSEFAVNQTTFGRQWHIETASLSDGGAVVVWETQNRDADGSDGIRARTFDQDGNPTSGDFTINATVAGDQEFPVVAGLKDGGFVVAYEEGGAIIARLFGPSSGQFEIAPATSTHTIIGMTALDGGGFALAWANTSTGVVSVQAFDALGSALGAAVQVGTSGGHSPNYLGSLLELPDGNLFVTWLSGDSGGSVYGRIVGADAVGSSVRSAFVIDTLSEIENVRGGLGDDILVGDGGANLLDGGAGDDTLTGGAGNDIFIVQNAGDSVVEEAGGGYDIVRSSLATYTLADYVEQGEIAGNTLGAGLVGNGGDNRLVGGDGADNLSGEGGNDELVGGTGNDTLAGGAGNDILDGGAGNDTLTGGAGNDIFIVDSLDDIVVEAADGGFDIVRTSLVDFTLADNVEQIEIIGGAGIGRTLSGNTGNNKLMGGVGADTMNGGDGDDEIEGGDGYDWILAGSGNDIVRGGNHTDNMWGGEGDDDLYGDDGDDGLSGNAGNDNLWGGDGGDFLFGQEGNDFLSGGAGRDHLHGWTGRDVILGGDGIDVLHGDQNDDHLEGGAGTDFMYGGTEADSLFGQGGADQMFGGSGNDSLYGWTGEDTLFGEDGDDVLYGDQNNDGLSGGAGDDRLYGGTEDDQLFGQSGNDHLDGGTGHDRLYGLDGQRHPDRRRWERSAVRRPERRQPVGWPGCRRVVRGLGARHTGRWDGR